MAFEHVVGGSRVNDKGVVIGEWDVLDVGHRIECRCLLIITVIKGDVADGLRDLSNCLGDRQGGCGVGLGCRWCPILGPALEGVVCWTFVVRAPLLRPLLQCSILVAPLVALP